MDVKEKLVELLGANTCKCDCCEDCEYCADEDACIDYLKNSMVDYLIAHSVTVQEWISVDEPPEKNGYYLIYTETGEIIRGYYKGYWLAGNDVVTHWQPMPQPPKGE